jgi:hypothetical protein
MTAPKYPEGLHSSGRALWRSVIGEYELEQHEAVLLLEACRACDLLDDLARIIDAEGPMIDGRVNPAVVEARQLKIALARLVAALRLPAGEEGDEQQGARRPQRRVGARGVYQLRGAS